MFQKVLVGLDGGPGGRDALAVSKALLSPGGSLTLLHAHPGDASILGALAVELVRVESEASERLLAEERTRAAVDAELVSVVSASPGAALHQQAETSGVDLIVVGSSSRGPWGRVRLGDDTRAALNGAPCAVAIATRGYAEAPKAFSHVGVAYNGSSESEAALDVARRIAASSNAKVTALEVVGIPAYAYGGMAMAGEDIDLFLKAASERVHMLPGVEGRAVYGLAGEELAAFGDEVDILVVGSRGYGPFRRLVAGSTANYLERHARCTLLVLPRGATSEHPVRDARPSEERASAPA